METIKCKKCGQVMGAASEVCPVCGCPTKEEFARSPAPEQQMEQTEETLPMLPEMPPAPPVQEPPKEEVFVSASGKVYNMNGTKAKGGSKVWMVVVGIVLALLVAGGGFFVYTMMEEKNDDEAAEQSYSDMWEEELPMMDGEVEEYVEYEVADSDTYMYEEMDSVADVYRNDVGFDVKKFVKGYYDAVVDGSYLSYFEYDDITFFDLEHVDREAIKKRMSHTSKYPTSREYDWATLETETLPSGAVRAVYSCDYYIHYQTRTDKYRIQSEMVISPRQKIQSIKDLETVKVGSY